MLCIEERNDFYRMYIVLYWIYDMNPLDEVSDNCLSWLWNGLPSNMVGNVRYWIFSAPGVVAVYVWSEHPENYLDGLHITGAILGVMTCRTIIITIIMYTLRNSKCIQCITGSCYGIFKSAT